MDDQKSIGARIRAARTEKGLTQADLAAAIGVTRSHLTNVEGGNDALSLDKLSILARETETTVAWLIGETKYFDQPRADLLAAYDAMNEEQRHALLTMVKVMMRRENTEEATSGPSPKRRPAA